MQGSKVSAGYHVHKYSVILFERVKVMLAIARKHLCFGGDSLLSYVNNKVLLFFFTTTALSSKIIQLNRTTICKYFPTKYL